MDMIFGRESKAVEKVLSPFGIFVLLFTWLSSLSVASSSGLIDTPFVQEYHEAFPLAKGHENDDVRAVSIDHTGSVWAGARAGVYRLDQDTKQWKEIMSEQDAGPVYDIVVDRAGTAWIATSKGVSAIKRKSMTLAEKADYYLDVCLARHVRAPGLVEKCSLRVPGDTSSDEITGHMFGYLFYYDLVADETEKRHVARHILNIVDYIIEGGYVLRGMDGRHTKWGVWAPEKLNQDPDWAPERGINSVEILSYLKLAYHVSGDERYQKEYMNLLDEHDYASNVRRAKTTNPTWRTHIDDELLALAYPCLMMHEDDPKLRRLYRESVDHWYNAVKADCSPFFEFIYGACVGRVLQLEISVASLRDASLDLVRWTVDNSHREDLRIVHTPEWEHLQTSRLLPLSERGVIRWDENPWRVIQGDGGHTESDGVWWLLPYWMGRCYSYIQPPQ